MQEITEDFKQEVVKHSKIVIVGYPKSGKTTFVKQLLEDDRFKGYDIIHTDDFMNLPFKEQLYTLIGQLEHVHEPWIVEGIQGFRLLRKIEQMQLESLRPTFIIWCKTDRPVLEKHERQRKGLAKIWNDYIDIRRENVKVIEWVN